MLEVNFPVFIEWMVFVQNFILSEFIGFRVCIEMWQYMKYLNKIV